MIIDEVLEEIYRNRMEIFEKVDYDLTMYSQFLKRVEEREGVEGRSIVKLTSVQQQKLHFALQKIKEISEPLE